MTSTNAALCATLLPSVGDLWFSTDTADRAEAKRHCRRCPLLLSCREEGMADPERRGVWGGLSAHDRGRLRGQAADTPDPDDEPEGSQVPVLARRRPCGTPGAYLAHRRYREPVDAVCRVAHEARVRARQVVLLAGHHERGGSASGYRLHQRMGEEPCGACRAAMRRASAQKRARARAGQGCGSESALLAHRAYGERCAVCEEAAAVRLLAVRRARLAEFHAGGGSRAGYTLHRRIGEAACALCLAAASAERRGKGRAAPSSPGLTIVPGTPGGSDRVRGAQAAAGAAA